MIPRNPNAYVVDTGKPNRVAMVKKVADATRAHAMPNIRTAGSSLKKSTLMTLLRMVSATRELLPSARAVPSTGLPITHPTSTAPRNSHTAAIHMACRRVRDREDTEVANELATSLAPMLNASRKAKIMPMAKM